MKGKREGGRNTKGVKEIDMIDLYLGTGTVILGVG